MTFIEVVIEKFMNKQISVHFVDEKESIIGVIARWGENFIEIGERIINIANVTYVEEKLESAQTYQSLSTRETTREITGY